jgi:tRNA-2-methylthio-N6-dimethylallyladenosine synthase
VERPRRYAIRTYGCQMNVHDSEKVANLLHHAGLRPAADESQADLLVVNTCSIREKAEHRLYSDLGALRAWKEERPGRLVGVGGCVAQQVGDALLARFPQLDFAFGTHNLRWVPSLIAAAEQGQRRALTDESASLERFDLPERHPAWQGSTPGRAFVTVMEGCDMFCSFCIVPATRGREISRPAAQIVREAEALVARGVRELTLLGQTVNAYGRHDQRRGRAERSGTLPFAELLGRLDAIPGLARLRYTSPHPLFFDDGLIRAHGALERLCPHVHLPLQSGSDRVLARMRRRYTRARFLEIAAALRAARPDVALTTDLIVGFPGETERDFEDTLDLVRQVGFADAYCFKYSPRPGTKAADLAEKIPAEESQRRLQALQSLQRGLTLDYHRGRVGTRTEILLEGPSARGRRDPGVRQLAGRDPHHRVVNVDWVGSDPPAEGELLGVEIAEATPHSLIGLPLAGAAEAPGTGRVKEGPRSADETERNAVLGPPGSALL